MMDTLQSEPKTETPAAPRKVSAARNALSVFITRLVVFPVLILTSILVARILGPGDRGRYAFLTLLGSQILPLVSFGFAGSIVYFISSRKYKTQDVAYTCLLVGLFQGAVSATFFGLLWRYGLLGKTASHIPLAPVMIVLVTLPIQSALLMISRIAVGESWFSISNVQTLSMPLLMSGSLILFVAVARWGQTGAATAIAVSNTILLTMQMVAIWKRARPRFRVDRRFIAEGYHYGMRVWFGDLAMRANLRVDQFVLGVMSTPEALGLYSIAVNVSELLWILPDSLSLVMYNKIAAAPSQKERVRLTDQVHRALLVIMIGLGLFFAILGHWLILFMYGKAYVNAALPLAVLIPGSVVLASFKIISKFFGASGMPGKSSFITIVGASIGIALYFLLIPPFGLIGAAAASSTCYIVTTGLAIILYYRTISPEKPHLFTCSILDFSWLFRQLKNSLHSTKHKVPS
jgi:O-antigen/teichoic acid export membrane protein